MPLCSNGWDDATAALQLLSHLEGDALNVALLVPAPQGLPLLPLPDSFCRLRLRRLICLGRVPLARVRVSGAAPSSWIVYRVVNTG